MAYRLRYQAWLDWVGPGMGPMGASLGGPLGGAVGASGSGQTLAFFNADGGQNIGGTGANGVIVAADITTLTNGMAADISTQMNAASALAQLQGFATGGN